MKADTDRSKALERFFDRHPRPRLVRESYPDRERIFGIRLGPQWRAVCEKYLR
jgi:hypothetical protein